MEIWSCLDPVILNKCPFDLTPPRFVEALVTPPPPHPPQLYTGAEQCVVTLASFHLSFCLAALYHMIWVQINHSGISESCVWLLTCSSSVPLVSRFFLFKLDTQIPWKTFRLTIFLGSTEQHFSGEPLILFSDFFFLVLCKPHSVLLARVALYPIGATGQV